MLYIMCSIVLSMNGTDEMWHEESDTCHSIHFCSIPELVIVDIVPLATTLDRFTGL